MASFRLRNLMITTEKKGTNQINKTSFPQRFGKYAEIKTTDYEFQFNLNGEVKSIRGLNMNWPHPSEILKRTDGNDWVYHSVGVSAGTGKIRELIGEYYLPCPSYPTNSVWSFNPYADTKVSQAFAAWYQLFGTLYEIRQQNVPREVGEFIDLIITNDDSTLLQKKEVLHTILKGEISVLPPDTRYVDYDVIPLMISDGCNYHCDFCKVKTKLKFRTRSKESILDQLNELKGYYGRNIENYTGLFLGNHDGLAADDSLIEWSASEAYERLGLKNSYSKNLKLFLFSSVDSLLNAGPGLFDWFEQSPYDTHLNIGFESVDETTLARIKKPIAVDKVRDAFDKMLVLNREYPSVEVTANFLLGEQLPEDHNRSLKQLLGDLPDSLPKKGTVYLSPLMGSTDTESLLPLFYELKSESRLPTYLYLIQRL